MRQPLVDANDQIMLFDILHQASNKAALAAGFSKKATYSSSTLTGRPVSMDLLQARVKLTDLKASR